MSQGFGLAALFIVLISTIIPVVGIYTTALAMIFAAVAALSGDRVYAAASGIFGIVSLMFFSPMLWLVMVSANETGADAEALVMLTMLASPIIPFIAIVLNATGKVALGKLATRT